MGSQMAGRIGNRMGKLLAAMGIVLLLGGAAYAGPSTSGSRDESSAQASLGARADWLSSRQRDGSKLGAAYRMELETEVRQIERLKSDLRSGRQVDSAELARLIGPPRDAAGDDREMLSAELETRRRTLDRGLQARAKVGAVRRKEIRRQIDDLDDVIGDLEGGGNVEVARARLDPASAVTAEERARDLEGRKQNLERARWVGRKPGALRRARIRDEIEALDEEIARLEDR